MSVHTSLRIPGDKLRQIDQLASQHKLSRTEYMILAALGELPTQRTETTNRVQDLEERLERLERWRQDTIDSQGNW